MIKVNNRFQENNLNIGFSGDSIDTNEIIISVSNDVNFKPVIDYLIQVIPKRLQLTSTFEDYSQQDNIEKLTLIEQTIIGIYDRFNASIDQLEASENIEEEPIDDDSVDDLPF